jgi:hypothetical protein
MPVRLKPDTTAAKAGHDGDGIERARVEVAGVSLSHPDRALLPAVGVTKLGLK